jgi:hypothetical protein
VSKKKSKKFDWAPIIIGMIILCALAITIDAGITFTNQFDNLCSIYTPCIVKMIAWALYMFAIIVIPTSLINHDGQTP